MKGIYKVDKGGEGKGRDERREMTGEKMWGKRRRW